MFSLRVDSRRIAITTLVAAADSTALPLAVVPAAISKRNPHAGGMS